MSEGPRIVKSAGKNAKGDITWLCNSGRFWSPRPKVAAIRDIQKDGVEYRVGRVDGPIVEVVDGPNGLYLMSRRDPSSGEALEDLPSC